MHVYNGVIYIYIGGSYIPLFANHSFFGGWHVVRARHVPRIGGFIRWHGAQIIKTDDMMAALPVRGRLWAGEGDEDVRY